MTSGAPALERCLREIAEAIERFGRSRYQDGFRAGILASERRERLPKPPPIPPEARRPPPPLGDDKPTPVHPADWVYPPRKEPR